MSTPQQAGQGVPGTTPPNVVAALESDVVQIATEEAQVATEATASGAPASLGTAVSQIATDDSTVVADVVADEGDQ